MKVLQSLALASHLATMASSMSLPKLGTRKVVALDLQRRYPDDLLEYERRRWRKRDHTVELSLTNEETLYFANITLGTPAQSLELHIDTGSSDLWVNTANSSFCSHRKTCDGGTYNSASSSTLQTVNSAFNISYADGTGAAGNYVTDTLGIGSVTLTDFQFGLGKVSTSTEGILGIGYTSNEVQVVEAGLNAYPNLPQALTNGGHIARNAYSLWLNDQEASTGTILFGGINAAKYQGHLATIPILEVYGAYSELMIALTGISVAGTNLSSNGLPVAALLDSGTTLTYLPTAIASNIYQTFDVSYDESVGYGSVDCSLVQQDSTVDYTFSGQTISVPLEELVISEGSQNSGRPSSRNGVCIFGIAPTDGISVFGDTFLRSAYVVYDLENNQISLAQTVFNATDDDIQEIPSGTSLPPGATLVADAVTSVSGYSSLGTSLSSSLQGNEVSSAPKKDDMRKLRHGLFAMLVLISVLL